MGGGRNGNGAADVAWRLLLGVTRRWSPTSEGDDGDVEKGSTHSDLWRMDLKSWRWEKQKKAGMAPGPRAGATSATHGAKKFAEHNTSSYKLICIKTQASKNLFHLC